METNNKMDELLKKQMSLDESGVGEPSLGLVRHARAVVMKRNGSNNTDEDIFYIVARFLNFHVKLSYVVIFVFGLGLASIYFTKTEVETQENISSPYVVNIASARSSTVLSSIVTFETRH